MTKSSISDYYNYTLPFYEHFWHRQTHALHYGLWMQDTKTLRDALLNTNKCLANLANITKSDIVLDAGCGIGGSSIWLAQNIGCRVVGLTISDKQVSRAKELVAQSNLVSKVQIFHRDFTDTKFSEQMFDVVWAIESVCHAEDKLDFLNEAFRVLKDNGRIIVADGFQKRDPTNKKEAQLLRDFCLGLELPNITKFHDFKAKLQTAGFRNITIKDATKEVLPSSKRLNRLCRPGYYLSRLTELVGFTPRLLTLNNLAGIQQYRGVKAGLLGYGIFCAQKVPVSQPPTNN